MKPSLVIGTSCVDVILTMDHLPVTAEDINPTGQSMSVGGCAYNVAYMMRLLGARHIFISPIGSGLFGDYVAKHFEKNQIPITVKVSDQENGCCYCLVEKGGERTFLSYHGVEYTFQKEWMNPYPAGTFGYAYVCGLEVEEPTGENLVSYLEEHQELKLIFAPGPRGIWIQKERMKRILALHPILHINEQEAGELSGEKEYRLAARKLQKQTHNTVIITLGSQGAYCLKENGDDFFTPTEPVEQVVDTIGAGDSHVGTILACLTKGMKLEEAIPYANRVAAAVIQVKGASLPADKLPEL
jgi:sugar/nucleoside kinase (ribokinase family)